MLAISRCRAVVGRRPKVRISCQHEPPVRCGLRTKPNPTFPRTNSSRLDVHGCPKPLRTTGEYIPVPVVLYHLQPGQQGFAHISHTIELETATVASAGSTSRPSSLGNSRSKPQSIPLARSARISKRKIGRLGLSHHLRLVLTKPGSKAAALTRYFKVPTIHANPPTEIERHCTVLHSYGGYSYRVAPKTPRRSQYALGDIEAG